MPAPRIQNTRSMTCGGRLNQGDVFRYIVPMRKPRSAIAPEFPHEIASEIDGKSRNILPVLFCYNTYRLLLLVGDTFILRNSCMFVLAEQKCRTHALMRLFFYLVGCVYVNRFRCCLCVWCGSQGRLGILPGLSRCPTPKKELV